jgi:CRP-like cAMP-binding protein
MMESPNIDLRSTVRQLFAPYVQLGDEEVLAVADIVQMRKIGKNEIFIWQTEVCKEEYFFLDGLVQGFVLTRDGEEITLSFYDRNAVLLPHMARTVANQSTMNFRSLETTTLLKMEALNFAGLRFKHKGLRLFGQKVVEAELMRKTNKEIALAAHPAKTRLQQFRSEYPGLENRISHHHIASYLGITPVSLSRLRKDLTT